MEEVEENKGTIPDLSNCIEKNRKDGRVCDDFQASSL